MAKERKAYAPFSLTSEAGVAQTPVEGYIDVRQEIYPIVSTGTINENGKWTGVKSSDTEFIGLSKAEGVAVSGEVLFPDTANRNHIDMTGFTDLFIAIKTSDSSTVQVIAVMGPDTNKYANLEPVNAGTTLRGNIIGTGDADNFSAALVDTSEGIGAGVWSIFSIQNQLKNWRNIQIKVVNDSGGARDLEFGFMRIV